MITSVSTVVQDDLPQPPVPGLYVLDDSDVVVLVGLDSMGMVVFTNPDVNTGLVLWQVINFMESEYVLVPALAGGTMTVTQG